MKKVYVTLTPEILQDIEKKGGTLIMKIDNQDREIYTSTPYGCGKLINWKTDTESLDSKDIMKLFGVDSIEKAKEFLNIKNKKEPIKSELNDSEYDLEKYKNKTKEKIENLIAQVDKSLHKP